MPLRQDPISANPTPALMAALTRTISAPRFSTYLKASGHDQGLALRLYLWNVAIGQAFHFPLQAAEVALRNVMSEAIERQLGAQWWANPAARSVLEPKRCEEIDKSVQRLRKKYGANPAGGQVVASLTLGFWSAMMKRMYNGPIWDHEIDNAFPNRVGTTIDSISANVNRVQELRNRIFHQEPLIGMSLTEEYSAISRLIGWICPQTKNFVRDNSSVMTVIRQKPR